jgi:hypothetical protein
MNTLEINNKLKHFKNFNGVFPRDKLPKLKNGTIIVNTDKSSEPGEHWVAITINKKEPSEYFDSFGLPPLHHELTEYLNKGEFGWVYNTVTLQSINSATCGNYCVLYATLRCRGYKYIDIIELFSNNTKVNDKIVSEII